MRRTRGLGSPVRDVWRYRLEPSPQTLWRAKAALASASDTITPFVTDITLALPSDAASGDLLIGVVAARVYSTTGSLSGYTEHEEFASGTTGVADDVGSVKMMVYSKTHSGSESNPVVDLSASSAYVAYGVAAACSSEYGTGWSVATTTATAEASADIDLTGAAQLDLRAGDRLVVAVAHNTDAVSSHSGLSITVPGCTVGNIVSQWSGSAVTTSAYDGALMLYQAEILAGLATGAPRIVATASSGWVAVCFMRVRRT